MENKLRGSGITAAPHLQNAIDRANSVNFCFDHLWYLARQEQSISYSDLLKRLEEHLGVKVKKEAFIHVLRVVNARSWNRFGVLITVLVHCTNQMAGNGFFIQACKLRAIAYYPDNLESQRRVARQLQERVFYVAKIIQIKNQL